MDDGLKILLNTYWSSNGWKDGAISDNDFQQAKREGYMFDYPKRISHEQTLTKLADVLFKIKPQDVANAFLYSLSSRKLEYRSALGSLLDILGICGILSSNNYPCYDVKFADITWRAPVEHTNDFSFPLNRWQVRDGVNTERFQKVFGMLYTK
ncbi:hypothetical protein [Anaerocolumna jejuensis]|uniref:hypothetical protein n=1 Tax=Anaerocolumna jejuensis TaxID=259063 RepID=UPI003F7B6566